MFVSELFEGRSPRTGLMEKLALFKDDPTAFVTFTQFLKVGINPNSDWDDPVGIYAYPIEQLLRGKTSPFDGPNMGKMVPFAGDRPYAYIVHATGHMLELQRYTSTDLARDLAIVQNEFASALTKPSDDEGLLDALMTGWLDNWGRHPGLAFWRVTHRLANHAERRSSTGSSRLIWHKMIRACGYDGVVDRGEGIMHPNEPAQAVILHTGALRILEAVPNDLRA